MNEGKIAEIVEEKTSTVRADESEPYYDDNEFSDQLSNHSDNTEEEEAFEDGDEHESGQELEGDEEEEEEEDSISMDSDSQFERSESPLNSIASAASVLSSNPNSNSNAHRLPLPQVAASVLTELSQTSNPTSTSPPAPIVMSSTTLQTISEYLQNLNQAHHHHPAHHLMPHKVRLSGPIRANVNIRHGVWAPRLRCRKRKNLHAKDGIWIHPSCTLDQLVSLVRSVLPDEFEWDSVASPLRYQAVNDQSLQSLKTVGGTVQAGNNLYTAFDLVRNRRSDGDNFVLQLFVYGTWTILSKSPNSNHLDEEVSSTTNFTYNSAGSASIQPPPPKKKYQQVHFNQMQRSLNNIPMSSSNPASLEYSQPTILNYNHNQNHNQIHNPPPMPPMYNSHPLAANPPVTFLPTVTLEMKVNGVFVPVEISRRSFVSAYRACTISRPPLQSQLSLPEASSDHPSKLSDVSTIKSSIAVSMMSATPPPEDVNLVMKQHSENPDEVEDSKKETVIA